MSLPEEQLKEVDRILEIAKICELPNSYINLILRKHYGVTYEEYDAQLHR